MEKNEVLSNLYTLRAGMSVISQENDKIVKAEQATKNTIQELCCQSPRNSSAEYIFSEQSITDAQNAIAQRTARKKQSQKKVKLLAVLSAAFVIGFIVALTLFISNFKSCNSSFNEILPEDDYKILFGILYMVLTLGCVGGFCGLVFFAIPEKKIIGIKQKFCRMKFICKM